MIDLGAKLIVELETQTFSPEMRKLIFLCRDNNLNRGEYCKKKVEELFEQIKHEDRSVVIEVVSWLLINCVYVPGEDMKKVWREVNRAFDDYARKERMGRR